MVRLRRVRNAPVPTGRVRRAPRALPDASTVSVQVTISADVTQGAVSPRQLIEMAQEAIDRYHLWRNGWVGIGATGKVRKPSVGQACLDE